MSEDSVVLEERVEHPAEYEKKIPVTIKAGIKTYFVNLSEFTDLYEVLEAVGADSARIVREFYTFETGPDGQQVRKSDPIVLISTQGKIESAVKYDLPVYDQNKLDAFMRKNGAALKNLQQGQKF